MARLSNNCVCYDFETLSQDPQTGIVVNMAGIQYSEERFRDDPYTFEELVGMAKFIKFDTKEQIEKYGRKPDKSTIDWWAKQNEEARSLLAPSSEDKSITELYDFCKNISQKPEKVYTRGNTFDPIYLSSLMKQLGRPDPWDWWTIRDTRSLIDGISYGQDLDNKFMPEGITGFIYHNPIHDVAVDIMRMQVLYKAVME